MLCGTPLTANNFGDFSGTVQLGASSCRCKTLSDRRYGIEVATTLDLLAIAA